MRKLLWFTIGFALACALGAYVYSSWLIFGIPISLLCFTVAVVMRKRFRILSAVAAVCLGLSVGLIWFNGYRTVYLMPVIEADGSEKILDAQIIDYSEPSNYGISAKAKLTIDGKTYRTVLYLKGNQDLKPGDSVRCRFRLRMTHDGLEGSTYHRGSRIFLLAYSQGEEAYEFSEQIPVRFLPAIFRQELIRKIDNLFPVDTAFFAKALLLGDRSDVGYEINTAFKVSGISHIIAVSGLHISILCSVIYVVARRKRPFIMLIGIPTLLFFAAVTGFTPSVTRACVMQILFILSDNFLWQDDPPTSLSMPVLIMLVCNPIAITSVSLQLSVGCMIGIFMFSEKIQRWVCAWGFWKNWKGKTRRVRFRSWIASGISVTFSSMFITMPLAAYYFGCVSLIGFLTNLLTLWAISWIFYGIMLVCLVGFFWHQGAVVIAWIVSWLMRYVLLIAKALSSFPIAAIYLKSEFILGWLVLCYVLIFAFLFWKKRKPFILIGSLSMSLLVAILLSWLPPMLTQSQVTILDVGQGQSIILQSCGKTFLVDCGGDDPEDAADQAAETLLSMGIYRLDGIILTHYDQDHCGGIPYLLSRIKTDSIYVPAVAEDYDSQQKILTVAGKETVLLQEDLRLEWPDCYLEIFAPVSQSDDNESGLSVLFCGRNCDILITGDMSISNENKLLLEKNIPQLTALVAGHHGSPYSTGDGLLSRTTPQCVFISVGADNPYGHPSEVVLERLSSYGCTVMRTDRDGTIVFRR